MFVGLGLLVILHANLFVVLRVGVFGCLLVLRFVVGLSFDWGFS